MVTGEPGSATRIAVERRPDGAWLDVIGSIASDATPASRDVAVADPTLYFTHAFVLAMIQRGIAVRGLPVVLPEPRNILAPIPRRVLVESQSPPLREIATTMMKVSQNLYAETLLKAVGAAKSGGVGSAEAGIAAARVFTAWRIGRHHVQADGSGLSRYDFVTAAMIAALLERMHKDPHHDTFVATRRSRANGTIDAHVRARRMPSRRPDRSRTSARSRLRSHAGRRDPVFLSSPTASFRRDRELDRRPAVGGGEFSRR